VIALEATPMIDILADQTAPIDMAKKKKVRMMKMVQGESV
jgi:hypothetical protein